MTWYSSTGIRPWGFGASVPAVAAPAGATSPGALFSAVPPALSPFAGVWLASAEPARLDEASPLEHAATSRRMASVRRSISDLWGDNESGREAYGSRITSRPPVAHSAARNLLPQHPYQIV